MVEFAWEEPPVLKKGRWGERLADLRRHPFRWAKFGPYRPMSAHSTVSHLRSGARGSHDPEKYEFVAHVIEGNGWIYVRYVPDYDPSDAVENTK